MSWFKSKGPFIILIILSIWVLFFSVWDILSDKGWFNVIVASFILILILTAVFLILRFMKTFDVVETFEEFEKTLHGGLFHFKCPVCYGFFAIKKSKENNDKYVKMNCPDCGALGIIPPHSDNALEEEIPEKKSVGKNFRCSFCLEGITIWAEGAELKENIVVYTCPFCGTENSMNPV